MAVAASSILNFFKSKQRTTPDEVNNVEEVKVCDAADDNACLEAPEPGYFRQSEVVPQEGNVTKISPLLFAKKVDVAESSESGVTSKRLQIDDELSVEDDFFVHLVSPPKAECRRQDASVVLKDQANDHAAVSSEKKRAKRRPKLTRSTDAKKAKKRKQVDRSERDAELSFAEYDSDSVDSDLLEKLIPVADKPLVTLYRGNTFHELLEKPLASHTPNFSLVSEDEEDVQIGNSSSVESSDITSSSTTAVKCPDTDKTEKSCTPLRRSKRLIEVTVKSAPSDDIVVIEDDVEPQSTKHTKRLAPIFMQLKRPPNKKKKDTPVCQISAEKLAFLSSSLPDNERHDQLINDRSTGARDLQREVSHADCWLPPVWSVNHVNSPAVICRAEVPDDAQLVIPTPDLSSSVQSRFESRSPIKFERRQTATLSTEQIFSAFVHLVSECKKLTERQLVSTMASLLDRQQSAERASLVCQERGISYGEATNQKVSGQPAISNAHQCRTIDSLQYIPWTVKYCPSNLDEMLMSDRTVLTEIDTWLRQWADVTEDGSELGDLLSTIPVLSSGPGSGKTCLVYALARKHDFDVLEINASSNRNGRQLLKQASEATQSHRVGNDAKESSQSRTLILIEDVDVHFADIDEGFLPAISSLVSTSKRPILLTVSRRSAVRPETVLPDDWRRIRILDMSYQTVSDLDLATVQLLCLAEGHFVSRDNLAAIMDEFKGDLRQTFNWLQFILQSGCTYEPYGLKMTSVDNDWANKIKLKLGLGDSSVLAENVPSSLIPRQTVQCAKSTAIDSSMTLVDLATQLGHLSDIESSNHLPEFNAFSSQDVSAGLKQAQVNAKRKVDSLLGAVRHTVIADPETLFDDSSSTHIRTPIVSDSADMALYLASARLDYMPALRSILAAEYGRRSLPVDIDADSALMSRRQRGRRSTVQFVHYFQTKGLTTDSDCSSDTPFQGLTDHLLALF